MHPFRDGNGRMARLLMLLLLYKANCGVGQYISLEKLVEDSRESYYDALYRSSHGWHEAEHDLPPGRTIFWAPSWPPTKHSKTAWASYAPSAVRRHHVRFLYRM
ncbi:Fic family protein [Salinibacter ruber]|uniref:Fic family protein n=1 Tax=Salinibacter ruber TaxID=146919 RepID=UPI003C6E335E